MNRREVLQALSAGIAMAGVRVATPERLLASALDIHDRIGSRTPDRTPQVFTRRQDETVTAIAERIIPETDTPGARAARVNEFIDIMLAEWVNDDDRDSFIRGLVLIDVRATDTHGSRFVDLSSDQQDDLLASLDAEVTALREADLAPADHFFQRMKWFTLYGYYTSEIGATQELAQVIIPGRYDPCGPVRRDASGQWE